MNSGPVRATHILFVHPAAPHPGGAAHRKNFEKNDRGQKLRPENQFSILFIPVALARPPVPGHVIKSYRPVPHPMDQVDRGFIYVFGQLPGVRTKKTKKHPSCVTTPRSGLHISSYRYSVVSGPGRWFFTGELFFSGQGTGEDRKNKHINLKNELCHCPEIFLAGNTYFPAENFAVAQKWGQYCTTVQ